MKTDLKPGSPQRPWPRDAVWLFVVIFGLALGSAYLAGRPGTVAAVRLANAAAIAWTVTAAPGHVRGLLASAIAAVLAASLVHAGASMAALVLTLANGFEIAVGIALVRRTGRLDRFATDHASFALVLAAGALLPPLFSATLGAAGLYALGVASYQQLWADWYVGAAAGAVAMLPLVLTLRGLSLEEGLARLLVPRSVLSVAAVITVSAMALHFTNFAFVTIGLMLTLFAFTLPRLNAFLNGALLVVTLAAALAFGWYAPPDAQLPLRVAAIYLAALMVVVPTQLEAVVVAQQRALSEMLAAVGSRTDDIVEFANLQGTFRWVNRAREDYWGVSNDLVVGRSWARNLGEPLFTEVVNPLLQRAAAGTVAHRMAEIDFPAKGRRLVELVAQPAQDEDGRLIGILLCSTDVTELETSCRALQRVADELRASNQSLEQFVRIASHDLREPLNTVAQFCDLIDQTQAGELSATSKTYFAQVRGGALRMKAMLDDVLQFVRLDAAPEVAMECVDLDAVLAEVLLDLAAQIESKGATIESQALGSVTGHRSLLKLGLQNLVSNAIKFVPPERPPRVRISATCAEGIFRLTVEDNGIGIDPSRRAELGTPFRRLHSRRNFDGTGLGLAICKRIAEQHRGWLEIESTPDGGSRIGIALAPEGAAEGAADVWSRVRASSHQ